MKIGQLWDRHNKLESQINELSQTVRHKRGAKWHGKVGRLRAQQRAVDRNIYKLSRQAGIATPPGLPPKNGRTRKPKAFGSEAAPFGSSALGARNGLGTGGTP